MSNIVSYENKFQYMEVQVPNIVPYNKFFSNVRDYINKEFNLAVEKSNRHYFSKFIARV